MGVEVTKLELVTTEFRGGRYNIYRAYFTEEWGPIKTAPKPMLVLGTDELDAYNNFISLRGEG
jgi:hypothetical protein